jgi:hypothetical protein
MSGQEMAEMALQVERRINIVRHLVGREIPFHILKEMFQFITALVEENV